MSDAGVTLPLVDAERLLWAAAGFLTLDDRNDADVESYASRLDALGGFDGLTETLRLVLGLIAPTIAARGDTFVCPRCRRRSHHRVDVVEGYCGACHDWTGTTRTERGRGSAGSAAGRRASPPGASPSVGSGNGHAHHSPAPYRLET